MTVIVIGVLALQGGFVEHISSLKRLKVEGVTIVARQVRTAEQLESCDGLIIPGGESTTFALIATREGLLAPLKKWTSSGRPTWGTCAGAIMIADRLTRMKVGGQAVIGGLDVTIERNHFGSQVDSFEQILPADKSIAPDTQPCRAIFIRAPIITQLGSGVKPLMALKEDNIVVACEKDNMLATCFHPELTSDLRWHRHFVDIVLTYLKKTNDSNTNNDSNKRLKLEKEDEDYDIAQAGHKINHVLPVID